MRSVLLHRITRAPGHTYGLLVVLQGVKIIYVARTLENADKLFPDGNYELRLEHSPAFGTKLWELYGITGRSEIKVHIANKREQLRGCIALGMAHTDIDGDGDIDVANSAKAIDGFHKALAGLTKTTIRVKTC